VSANTRVKLPSIRVREGDATVAGYELQPSRDHLGRVSTVLGDIAERVTMAEAADSKRIEVRLAMMTLPLGMPMQLFYFALTEIDGDGRPSAPNASEGVTAVLIANQPLPLVRDVALRFFLDLIARSGPASDVAAGRRTIDELPGLIAATEAETGLIAWEALSYDWTRAADVIRERAAARGLALSVSHTPDLFDSRDELTRRLPALRRLYREEERIRQWVDHGVAALGAGRLEMRGGSEDVRLFVQQQMTTAGLPQMLAQAFRDGFICGNGYLRPELVGLDLNARCLLPERVEATPNGFVERRELSQLVHGPEVMHFRVAEQLNSPYGVSGLEPLLFVAQHRTLIAGARELSSVAPDRFRQDAERHARTADAMEHDLEARLLELTGVVEILPRDIPDDLYFPGQELV
jgi:hypothetical protein